MTIDPRMAARRRKVAESRARIDLRRFLWFMVAVAAIGLVGWFLTSPIMSVNSITIFGATNADPGPILAEQDVVDGRPLVAIRPGKVADALEADPWIRAASVELVFPDMVEVNIDERVPVAWVSYPTGWALVDREGVVLRFGVPAGEHATISLDLPADESQPAVAGEVAQDQSVLGAVAFVHALPDDLAPLTEVFTQDGELWATVGERRARLGRPIEMSAKAAAVVALLDAPQIGVIDVIAPTRPAIWQPHLGEPESPDDETDSDEAGAATEVDGEG